MNAILATHDLLWIVLDSLRYDVARDALNAGETPNLERLVSYWEERHSPATFTWAAHHAFFSGFLPTPARNPRQTRLFAARFSASGTISPRTFAFDEAYLPVALAQRGFHTLTIGGVGFFNERNAIGRVFPGLFAESHWAPELGPESPVSAERQLTLAAARIAAIPEENP